MRVRLFVASFIAGALATATSWLTMLPLLERSLQVLRVSEKNSAFVAQLKPGFGYLAVLDGLVASVLVFLVCRILLDSVLREPELTSASPNRPEPPVPAAREKALDRGELLRLQSDLVASDRLATVGKLASGVAHEVGNPLSGLTGYLSILQDKLGDRPDLKVMVVHAEGEVQRIDGIVRALLELGRPSRGKAEIIDARPVAESCVRLLGASEGFREVAISLEGESTLLVLAEAGPLSQVVVNLLLNAAQAMGQKGRVHVTLAQKDGKGVIEVKDDGPGIPPEVMPRLFELFFTTKDPGKGTGLGLAMSRHLLAQFGGEIVAENAQSGGAIFSVRMPLPPQAPVA